MTRIAQERRNMAVSQLFTNEVDKHILDAMVRVSREDFLPENLKHCAYADDEQDVGSGRFQMEPLVFGRLLTLADITPESRVLIIGCLSGYSVAVVTQLAAHVVATESDKAFFDKAQANLAPLKLLNLDLQPVKNLADGYGMSAPYDVILIEGAVEFIPDVITEQLSLHGRIVTVRKVGDRPGIEGGMGRGVLVRRINNQPQCREYFDVSATVLPGFKQPASFVF